MKNWFLAFAVLLIGACGLHGAPVAISDLPLTNNPSGLSLINVSALTGASTYTSRAQTISNLVETVFNTTPRWIAGSNALVAYTASQAYGITNGSWHLTNAGVRLVVKSNATEYVTYRGGRIGFFTNDPQATLHIYGSTEPQLQIDSTSDDINHFIIKAKGIEQMTLSSAGQQGGVLSLFGTNGSPTVVFNPSGQSYFNLTNSGLSIGTNNSSGYGFFVAGNAYIRDGLTLAGSTTNLGTMRNVGSVTYPNLSSNYVMVLDAASTVTVGSVLATNILESSVIRSQAVPISATNNINFATNAHQYYVVTNDTAFRFYTASTNYGGGQLTLYNGGGGTYNLYYPGYTHPDNGVAPPATIASNEFFTIQWRWQNGYVHIASTIQPGLTVHTNGVLVSTASILNFVGATGAATTGTNTITITGGAGGSGPFTNVAFYAASTNDVAKFFNNGAGLTFYFSSNGIPHSGVLNTDFYFDGTAGVFYVGTSTFLTLDGSSKKGIFAGALEANGTVGQPIDIFAVKTTNGVSQFQVASNGVTMMQNSLVVSNQWFKAFQATVVSQATNYVVDFNRSDVELPSSLITNGIFVVHCTNGPAAGTGTNVYTTWTIDTGNTNRHFYPPPEVQGNIFGTNTTTTSFMLPSNSVVRVVFERRRGLISGDFMSYPVWTP